MEVLITTPTLFLESGENTVDHSTTNIMVATYGTINSYPGKNEIITQSGRCVSILRGKDRTCGHYQQERITDPKKSVKMGLGAIKNDLLRSPEGSLAILYAGNSLFSDVAQLALSLARQNIKVALVTCGCRYQLDFKDEGEDVTFVSAMPILQFDENGDATFVNVGPTPQFDKDHPIIILVPTAGTKCTNGQAELQELLDGLLLI